MSKTNLFAEIHFSAKEKNLLNEIKNEMTNYFLSRQHLTSPPGPTPETNDLSRSVANLIKRSTIVSIIVVNLFAGFNAPP